jgi:hypothetical protein
MKLVLGLLLAASSASIGCGSDNGGTTADGGTADAAGGDGGMTCAIPAPTFTAIYTNLLNTPTCNPDGICHGNSTPPNGGLNFKQAKDAVHAALLGATTNPNAVASFPNKVTPMMPGSSFFYEKLNNPQAISGLMPLGAVTPIPQCQRDAIQSWIDNGAAND